MCTQKTGEQIAKRISTVSKRQRKTETERDVRCENHVFNQLTPTQIIILARMVGGYCTAKLRKSCFLLTLLYTQPLDIAGRLAGKQED